MMQVHGQRPVHFRDMRFSWKKESGYGLIPHILLQNGVRHHIKSITFLVEVVIHLMMFLGLKSCNREMVYIIIMSQLYVCGRSTVLAS